MPIDATNGFSGVVPAGDRPVGMLPPISRQPLGRRLLLEADDLALVVEPEDAHLRRVVGVTGCAAMVMSALPSMCASMQLAEVHAVEVVAGEDQVVVGVVAREVARRLAHRVGRALEPVGAVGRLLGGEDLDEAAREQVQPVGLRDVAVERRGVELRQHEDALEAGVQAVADRDVDQAVLAAERHGRLRAHVRQREEARAAPAAENQGQARHSCRQYLILRVCPEGISQTASCHESPSPQMRSSRLAKSCIADTPPLSARYTRMEPISTGRRPVVGPEGAPDRERIVSRCRYRTPSPPTGRLAGPSAIPPCRPPQQATSRAVSPRGCANSVST